MSSPRLRGGAPQAQSGGELPPEKTRFPQPSAAVLAPAVPPLAGRVDGSRDALSSEPGVRRRFLRDAERWLPPAGSTVVVAVSGGADSMALWDLCVRYGHWQLVIWHLNHGVRPDAADDAALIQHQAAAYRDLGTASGEIIVEHCDITALSRHWHIGVEEAGRRYRYERLAVVAASVAAAVVCTAHHRDDQAETVLANLLRGAGPIGMMGIARRRRLVSGINLVRPLLYCTRDNLRQHLHEHQISWREDSTNSNEQLQRNRLRRRVLPALERLAPGAAAGLARLAARTRRRTRADRHAAQSLWRSFFPGSAGILARSSGGHLPPPDEVATHAAYVSWAPTPTERARMPALPGKSSQPACDRTLPLLALLSAELTVRLFVFRHLLLHLHLSLERQHLDRLDRLAAGPVGKRLHLGRWLLRRAPDALVWEEAKPVADLSTVTITAPGIWQRGDRRLTLARQPAPRDPRADTHTAWLDAALSLPFMWRLPIAAERWRPLGASGSQTVTKTLGEHDIPSRRRPLTAVLADANGVLWIPGIAVAERARVVATATSGWRLTLEDAPRASSLPPMLHPTVSVVILAAGKGTRMGSDLAKVLHPLAGRPLVSHVLDACTALGVGQSVVVVGHQRDAVEAVVKPLGAETALQDKQLGTGHAVLVTKPVVRGDTVIVLCGDCPMTPPSLLNEVLAKHRSGNAACTAVAARLADPGKYGRMITNPTTGRLARIVEWKDASEAERAVNLINSGIYAFAAADLWRCLERVKPNNAQGEYYLTDVVGMLVAEGRPVELVVTDDMASVLGINTPTDLAEAEQLYAKRVTA